jgi:hypothetical protein
VNMMMMMMIYLTAIGLTPGGSSTVHTHTHTNNTQYRERNTNNNKKTGTYIKVPRNRPEGPEGRRGIALLLLDLSTRRGGWSAPRSGRFTLGKDPVPIVQEAGWARGPGWTGAKNLAPTGIRSPDRPARS